MSLLQHPVVQSFVLPAGLSLLALALLSVAGAAGRARAGFAPALALLASLALLPGFGWPPRTAVQQLPWIVAGVLLGVVVVHAVSARWPVGSDPAGRPGVQDSGRFGGLSLAALAVGAAGLAALAVVGGSLLLAQLAGMLASSCGAAAIWVLARPATRVTPWALVPLATAGVLVAAASAGRVGALPLALLALALVPPWPLARAAWAARRPRAALLATGALAALPVALALGLALGMPPTAVPGTGEPAGAPADDPYYNPRWQ